MFQWYKNTAVCYAYLPNVPPRNIVSNDGSKFCSSSLLTGGWTLQELLAPAKLVFYNSQWEFIGTKIELSPIIESITRIPHVVLVWVKDLQQTGIVQRVS